MDRLGPTTVGIGVPFEPADGMGRRVRIAHKILSQCFDGPTDWVRVHVRPDGVGINLHAHGVPTQEYLDHVGDAFRGE